jgi:excinuclease ABC subunit A
MDIIRSADYIIDLGPEGGDQGGFLVAQGSPDQIVHVEHSYTGQSLKKYIERLYEMNKK